MGAALRSVSETLTPDGTLVVVENDYRAFLLTMLLDVGPLRPYILQATVEETL